MKKLFAVLLALSMIFILCACGTEDVSTAANTGTAEAQQEPASDNAAAESSTAPAEAEQAADPSATANTVLLSDIPGEPEGDLGSCHIKL